MNTQKGKGKEMKKLSSTIHIPFSEIYASKFDSVLKMKTKYMLSHTRKINLSSQIVSCGGTQDFVSVGYFETKPTVNTFLTFLCLKREETDTLPNIRTYI